MSKPGHNSKVKAGPVAGERLKSFVERIEKMEEERKAIGADIRDIYAEAKGVGYDVKTVRWVVQERRLDASDRAERDTLRDVYQHALDTAVGLVRGGLSLREAGRITGTSKSSIHRALAVPSVSQPAGSQPEDGGDGITGITAEQGRPEQQSPSGQAAPTLSGEAPAAPSVGAVAAEPRVATSNHIPSQHVGCDYKMAGTPFLGDDPGPPPAFLRRSA